MLVRWDGRSSSPEALFAFESNYQLTFANGNLGFSTKANASDIYGVSAANLKRRWVHIVAVFRNGNVTGSKLYIDGVAQTLTQKSGTPVSRSATRVASISGTDAGINHLTGSIDELAMWDSALSATQVANHAKAANSYTTSYSYDGDGLRSAKTSGGQTKTLTYDITAPYAQLAFDGENYYIYGPDGLPLEQVRSSNGMTDWFSHDVLGNTRFMADDWANMSAAFSYDAYGNVTASEGRVDTPLKYRGEQQDNDTGYVYLRARYYDPQTAQFTTLDPLVGQTRSPYSYANNSPLNFADPSGEAPVVVAAVWAGAELGLTAADGLSMLATLSDPCATRGAELAGVGFFVMGALGPGGGYGKAAEGLEHVDDILPKPIVSNQKLRNTVDELYRATMDADRTGDGTTAAAARYELATGKLVKGKPHIQKARQRVSNLNKLLRTQDLDFHDALVARSLRDDLLAALGGN